MGKLIIVLIFVGLIIGTCWMNLQGAKEACGDRGFWCEWHEMQKIGGRR